MVCAGMCCNVAESGGMVKVFSEGDGKFCNVNAAQCGGK